ncbi:MAG: NAD-dependent malic enzyme [Thermoanaerobaculia bacterium]
MQIQKSKPRARISTVLRGAALLTDPLLNKGTCFSLEERKRLGLEGLLPDRISSEEEQLSRVYENISRESDPLEKYIALIGLQDRNEHLFYKLLMEHTEEFLPIIYTPVVGQAAQQFSHIFRRARGVWITPDHRGRIGEILGNSPTDDVRLIVVTDNERILGLGDQGAGGMSIPIGKLALYTLAAGVHPRRTLPVSLDVGTNNEALLNDPLYLGWRHPRLRGKEYDDLVDEFVQVVKNQYPKALLQWEDFKKVNAMKLLDRYRKAVLSFNDDIQGTAAVALAGILAGVRATDRGLLEHRVVIVGAGAAGMGIARQVGDAFKRQGLAAGDLPTRIAVLDSQGLLTQDRQYRPGEEYKQRVSWPVEVLAAHGLAGPESIGLEQLISAFQPSVLIGTSGQPGAFTKSIVEAMAAHVDRPLIFPFSNPTSKSEATPIDLIRWTQGRALVATGSPFPPVVHERRKLRIGQGNNVFIFPGVGLGALVSGTPEITDSMFTVAAETLAAQVTDSDLRAGALYPSVTRLREISRRIAVAVVHESARRGLTVAGTDESIQRKVSAAMWEPHYPEIAAESTQNTE